MDKSMAKITLTGNEEVSAANHRFQTVWWTPAVVENVWETIAHYSAWPTWWRGIRKVEVVRQGDSSGVGTVLRQGWRSWIPYTLTFDLEMTRLESRRLLEGRARGDLEGICKWMFTPVNNGTEIRFEVNVRTGRWWMNLPIPFTPRIVRANFETIMRRGREGLQRKLGMPVELRRDEEWNHKLMKGLE